VENLTKGDLVKGKEEKGHYGQEASGRDHCQGETGVSRSDEVSSWELGWGGETGFLASQGKEGVAKRR